MTTPEPPRRSRLFVALLVGIVSALAIWLVHWRVPALRTDFDQTWFAAKALLQGRDPYPLIGLDKEFWYGWGYYYPLSAPVSILPLGALPLVWARMIFGAVSGGVLAYVATRDGWYRLPLFLGAGYFLHLVFLQWSVIMTAALFVPWLGFFGSAKPNIAIASVTGQRTVRDVLRFALPALIPIVASFAFVPGWVPEWFDKLREYEGGTPTVLLPGGFLLLAALLRWRRWEGRVFLALLCIPQTPGAMSALPLLLIPKQRRDVLILAVISYAGVFLLPFIPEIGAPYVPTLRRSAIVTMWSCFVPALYFLLRLPAGPDGEAVTSTS